MARTAATKMTEMIIIAIIFLVHLFSDKEIVCQKIHKFTWKPTPHSLWQPPSPSNDTFSTTEETYHRANTRTDLANGKCGIRPHLRQKRITGGKDAQLDDWPWQASVMYRRFFGIPHTHRCGGALLNVNWVVTSAHCVHRLPAILVVVRLGEYDLTGKWEPRGHVDRIARTLTIHPKYDPRTLEYDLALVELGYPVAFLPHISPLCLPNKDEEDSSLVGQYAVITGWGRLKENGALPPVLQEVTVRIISNERCEAMFRKAGHNEHIPDIFLCTDFVSREPASHCQGDSGGPLQLKDKDGRWYLAGIISWGISCSDPNLPSVYVRIGRFKDWLRTNMS